MAMKLSGAGTGRYSVRQTAEMNVTPFVDVMLVLLIIFMVSAPLATLAVKVDAPPAGHPTAANPTYVAISRLGISVSGAPTTLTALGTDLAHRLGARPTEQNILIRADRDVPYEAFMAVVNQLKTDGYSKLALVTEEAA